VAGGFGAISPVAAPGCGTPPPPVPVGGFFGLGSSWIWIIVLLIFVLPRFGFCNLGGLFGGSGWILILLLIVFLVPGILPGFRLGGFGI
jgi:hypothetical protein